MVGTRRAQSGWLYLLLLCGCYTGFDAGDSAAKPGDPTSDVELDPEPSDPDIPHPPDEPSPEVDCSQAVAGPPVLLRLTRAEYANTVRDLLGVSGDVALSFVPDGIIDGFSTNAVVPVTALQVEG